MKAIAICPHCDKNIETDCDACIDAKTQVHQLKNDISIIENIKWKIIDDGN